MKTFSRIDGEYIPVRSQEILARLNPGNTVSLMNLKNVETIYVIDGLAAEIWNLLDDKTSLSQLAKKIIKKHQPPPDLFYKDLEHFILQLKKEKMIS